MHYYASYVPLVREAEVLRWEPDSRREPTVVGISSAFDLKAILKPGDHLWLMMGSTNAAMALAAFRMEAVVHQLSLPRLCSWLDKNGLAQVGVEPAKTKEEQGFNGRLRVKPDHVLGAAQQAAQLFYGISASQTEALEIVTARQLVNDAMEARKAAANLLRSRIYQEAIVYGRVRGKALPADPKEAKKMLEIILYDLLDAKERDENGRANGRKRKPGDPHIAFLIEREERERADLKRLCYHSGFYKALFGDIEGVGPMIGSRVIAAVERIERFTRRKDLSNYGGFLPRGKEGNLPSRKRSKGQTLSRSPRLNTTGYLLQDQVFGWGRKSELGQRLIAQIERECPCTAQERSTDKELRKRYARAVQRARVATTRYFLEQVVWPRWRTYMGIS